MLKIAPIPPQLTWPFLGLSWMSKAGSHHLAAELLTV